MVEPVGLVGTLTGLIALTNNLIKWGRDVINYKNERQQLDSELEQLKEVLRAINRRAQQAEQAELEDERYRGVRDLVRTSGTLTGDGKFVQDENCNPRGPLTCLKMAMAQMMTELQPSDKAHTTLRSLRWHWDKAKFDGLLRALIRSRDNVGYILAQDEFTMNRDTNIQGRDTNIRVEAMQEELKRLANRQQQQDEARELERQEEERRRIEAWLSPFEFLATQEQLFEDHFEVGRWLLQSAPFESWAHGSAGHLWLYGAPGSGKTGLSCMVINHLQGKCKTHRMAVICIYLSHTDSKLHTRANLFGSLLKQFIQCNDRDPIPASLVNAYRRARKTSSAPKWQDLYKILQDQIETYDQVYLIVDALDECADRVRDDVERDLFRLVSDKLRLMITTRPVGDEGRGSEIHCDRCQVSDLSTYYRCNICNDGDFDICEDCKIKGLACDNGSHQLERHHRVEVEVVTPDEDIKAYVNWRIQKETGAVGSQRRDERIYQRRWKATRFGRRCQKNPELLELIPSTVVEKASGTFILAKLYVDSLIALETLKDIKDTLKGFPNELNQVYEQAMERLLAQNQPYNRHTALKVLSLVVVARRSLSLVELQHALSVRPGQEDWDEEIDYEKEDILRDTLGLIRIDNSDTDDDAAAVQLVHLTLLEYLDGTRDRWFPNAEVEMARVCLGYLSYAIFGDRCRSEDELEARRTQYPFLAYASQHWGDHVREANSDSEILASARSLIDAPGRASASIQAAWFTDRGSTGWDVLGDVDPLHICAWFGLSSLIVTSPEDELDIDVQETTYGQTPLIYACRKGHPAFAKQLLDMGASINLVSARGRTPLFEAILHNQKEVVNVLLNVEELDINTVHTKERSRTALMLAAQRDSPDILRTLLQHPEIQVNLQDSDGYTALSLAVINESPLSVEALLEIAEIKANLVDRWAGRSALHIAAVRDNSEMVRRLLEGDIDPTLKDRQGSRTAIHHAVDRGHLLVVETMMKYDQVDLYCLDDNHRGLVHSASLNGHPDIISLLAKQGLDLNAKDNDGLTPLHDASRGGNPQATEVLLSLGADPTIKDKFGRTPYTVARQYAEAQVMKCLESSGKISSEDILATQETRDLPMWSLVKQGSAELVAKALASGSLDLGAREPCTQDTALHWAVRANRIDLLEMLLDTAKDKLSPDSANIWNRTPLHLAALHSNSLATSVLIKHRAKLDLLDRWNGTALSLAQSQEQYPVAIALIEAGASVDKDKIDVQKIFFAALELCKPRAVKILLEEGADVLAKNKDRLTVIQIVRNAKCETGDDQAHTETLQLVRSTLSVYF